MWIYCTIQISIKITSNTLIRIDITRVWVFKLYLYNYIVILQARRWGVGQGAAFKIILPV